jgi:hypothetical protein
MSQNNKKKPFVLYLLMILILFQAISAIGGGAVLVVSPSGGMMGIPLSGLKNTPFSNFLIPGLILLILLGFFPLLIFISMIKQPGWSILNKINIYKDRSWIWAYSLYLSIMLIIWILIEIFFIGYDPLQTYYGMLGVTMLILSLTPQVMQYYKREK